MHHAWLISMYREIELATTNEQRDSLPLISNNERTIRSFHFHLLSAYHLRFAYCEHVSSAVRLTYVKRTIIGISQSLVARTLCLLRKICAILCILSCTLENITCSHAVLPESLWFSSASASWRSTTLKMRKSMHPKGISCIRDCIHALFYKMMSQQITHLSLAGSI